MRKLLVLIAPLLVAISNAQNIDEKLKKTDLLFYDECTGSWMANWMLDGLRGRVENSSEGMELIAGSGVGNDSCHAVLWTKQQFSGDICVEYEYTKTDSANCFVNILYLMATGKGSADFPEDISLWNDLRRIPYMQTYFNHMNAYHISYSAFPVDNDGTQEDYIRLRRYMPDGRGLKDTDVPGDVFNTGLFKQGKSYLIQVYVVASTIEMHVRSLEYLGDEKVFKWDASMYPTCQKGRIGLRHMYTRQAQYKNFKVWSLSK